MLVIFYVDVLDYIIGYIFNNWIGELFRVLILKIVFNVMLVNKIVIRLMFGWR